MRTMFLLMVLLGFLAVSCELDDFSIRGKGFSSKRDEISVPEKGFCMTIRNRVVLKPEDIDYYVLTTHMIYLKGDNDFLKEELYRDAFSIYADGEKIYSGVFNSWISSSITFGPSIYVQSFYGDYIVPITFEYYINQTGKIIPDDQRGDPRIVKALKDYGQFHEGLNCEIRSVQFTSDNQVKLELELINEDLFNYYYLDPVKMGMGLFHYFTNGLSFWDAKSYKSYSNNVQHIQPVPSNSWNKEWLSVIEKQSEKTIWIAYDNFEPVPAGQYKLNFRFPGLANVKKEDLNQQNGRIWLGELDLSRDFQVH